MSNAAWKAATIFANTGKRKPAPPPSGWRPPNGNTQHLIRVGRGELTCLECGEVFGVSTPVTGESTFCWRCGGKAGVPTVSYLHEEEYRIV